MDNIQDPVQAPQGQAPSGEQIPNVQSEAATQTAPTVEATTEAPKPSDETSFEVIAAKKGFKTPDDLAKAYANLEGLSTKTAQRAAQLEKEFFPQVKAQDTVQAQQFRNPDEEKALAELKNFGQKEFVEPLKREFEVRLKTELARMELGQVIEKHPDFANYTSDIKELKSKYPDMPFKEAYTFAKAMKGDLISEAKAEGLREGTRSAYKQVTAQVAPTKTAAEEKTIGPQDLLKGAANRWAIKPGMKPEDVRRIHAEQEYIEKQLQGSTTDDRDFLAFSRFNR